LRRGPDNVEPEWYEESDENVTWEHPAPRIVASSTASKLVITIAPAGPGVSRREGTMERIIERGCGLDVHKKSIAACVRLPGAEGQRTQEVRTFGTTATDLSALRDWLQCHAVTHVALKRTGVYCKPVSYVLKDALTWFLPN